MFCVCVFVVVVYYIMLSRLQRTLDHVMVTSAAAAAAAAVVQIIDCHFCI